MNFDQINNHSKKKMQAKPGVAKIDDKLKTNFSGKNTYARHLY